MQRMEMGVGSPASTLPPLSQTREREAVSGIGGLNKNTTVCDRNVLVASLIQVNEKIVTVFDE